MRQSRPTSRQHALRNAAQLDPAHNAHPLPNDMRRLPFFFRKRFQGMNVLGVKPFYQLHQKLALFPVVQLIEVFHVAPKIRRSGTAHDIKPTNSTLGDQANRARLRQDNHPGMAGVAITAIAISTVLHSPRVQIS